MLDEKTFEILIGAGLGIAGYIAGESIGLFKKLYRDRKLKKALIREIKDAKRWLLRNVTNLECMIQLSALDELANNGPVPIPVQVHAEHFPEINLKLKEGERTSFNAIYNLLYLLNSMCPKLYDLTAECGRDESRMYEYKQILDVMFKNTQDALYRIDWHIKHIKNIEAAYNSRTGMHGSDIHRLHEAENRRLLYLAGEARALGAKRIREKFYDGAASMEDVKQIKPPEVGKFYINISTRTYLALTIALAKGLEILQIRWKPNAKHQTR